MQKTLLTLSLTAVMALGGCGGNDSSDISSVSDIEKTPKGKLADQALKQMEDLADALETVNDEKSAREAAKKIAAISANMEALSEKYDGSGNVTKMQLVMKANSRDFIKIQTRMATSMMKLSMNNPELMEIISEEMDKFEMQ